MLISRFIDLGGYLGTLAKIAWADTFLIHDAARFDPNDYQNRNQVNGKWLTVPVLGGRDQRIYDVIIDSSKPWARKHYRTLQLAFGRGPLWERYGNGLGGWLAWPTYLSSLDWDLTLMVLDAMGSRASWMSSSALPIKGVKSAAIISMCQAVEADEYLFGPEGRNYADLEAFEKAGIRVLFQPPVEDKRSSLELLLTEGPERLSEMIDKEVGRIAMHNPS